MTTPITPDQYETWEVMILSDQVPADELAQLLEANPGFAAWYRRRAEARKSPKATCPNCNGTRRATYFSEQGWKHEERDCHLCALPSTHPEPGQ